MSQLLRKKPIVAEQTTAGGDSLKRVMGPAALTAMGIGAIIGTGIFVATGEVARNTTGPALMVSYVVAGLVCLFAALCYAEYAAMTPVAGSAYSYAYTTLGEIFAWIIGWDLILEYAVGAATVANGWSSYYQKILAGFGVAVDPAFASAPIGFNPKAETFIDQFVLKDGVLFNLPAVVVVGLLSMILIKGIKESAAVNAVMVAIKVGAVLFVILVGAFYVDTNNWTADFHPWGWFSETPPAGEAGEGKPRGMMAGAALIFFAYIGFDAVSTQAEEARNPQRSVPIGILASLLICTVLYVAVVAVLTGMVPYKQIDPKAGVATAFEQVGLKRANYLIAAAAIAGITSVLLVMLLGAARVLMAISRDGLLPPAFATVHPRFRTPWVSTVVVGLFTGLLAGLLPLDALLELTNIGTLFAFLVVCVAVLVLRRTNPGVPRPFRCPLVPVVPALGAAGCLFLMTSLHHDNWYRLFAWMAVGLVVYFTYSRSHSRLGRAA